MEMANVLGETDSRWSRRMLFNAKERTGGMENRNSPNLSSNEINSQQKAETANQDSYSQTQHFTWERERWKVSA